MKVRLSNLFKSKAKKKTYQEIVTEMEFLAESIKDLKREDIVASNVHMVFFTEHRDKESKKNNRPGMRSVVATPESVFEMLADTARTDESFGNMLVMASIGAEEVNKNLKKTRNELQSSLSLKSNNCDCPSCISERVSNSTSLKDLKKDMSDKEIEDYVNKIINGIDPDKE